jgi:O-antigen/teichoic acid export membrane protein
MWLTLACSLPAIVLRARQRFAELAAVQSIATLVQWAAIIGIAAQDGSLFAMLTVCVAVTAASATACAVLARRDLPRRLDYRFDRSVARSDARFAAGLFMMQLSSALVVQVDRLLIAWLASPAAAGIYALCIGIANKSLFAVSALTSFAYPRVAALRGHNMHDEIGDLLRVLLRVSIVVVAPTVLPALLLAGPFLVLWLGAPGEEAIPLLQLLWCGYAIAAVCAPATHVMIGTGASRLPAAFAWLTALLLVSAMVILIPARGLLGAGWANVIALSSGLLFLAVVRRQLAVPRDPLRYRLWGGVITGCAAQAALLWFFQPHVTSWVAFALAGSVSLLAYQSVRVLLNTVTPEEQRLIHSLVSRLR